ncbi:hypothetical protein DMN91_005568 [Ooceraea biroi]|uniref:Uncharacterized protein n=1 Tax=Ooceraea biroi TaxID=2015173 RepID=A0A3L8DL77_OOCBI|nr:hypothetical protein DMN91_005568 [Ooceraea biroi]
MDVRWKHPWTSIVCSPTECGKTIFHDAEEGRRGTVRKNNIIEFRERLPCAEDYSGDPLSPKLVIIDDLMRESSSSDTIVDLFTKGSHHKKLSVILISQNRFHQGRGQRDISLNANYIVVFKNPRDRAQIRHLARQVFPDDPKFLEEAYYDATETARLLIARSKTIDF